MKTTKRIWPIVFCTIFIVLFILIWRLEFLKQPISENRGIYPTLITSPTNEQLNIQASQYNENLSPTVASYITDQPKSGNSASGSNISAPSEPPPPLINTFTASSNFIDSGESVTLSWETQASNWVTLEPLGEVVTSGQIVIAPSSTTVYTLLGFAHGTIVSQQLHVNVRATDSITPSTRVVTFDILPKRIIYKGDSERVELVWKVEGNMDEVSINGPTIGNISHLPSSGALLVDSQKSTIFALNITNRNIFISSTIASLLAIPADGIIARSKHQVCASGNLIIYDKNDKEFSVAPDEAVTNILINRGQVSWSCAILQKETLCPVEATIIDVVRERDIGAHPSFEILCRLD